MDKMGRDEPSKITECRVCASPVKSVLDLGELYVSDFLDPGQTPKPKVPLNLVICQNHACSLLQLSHTTPPSWMYENYWYRSGTNESMVRALHDVVSRACQLVHLEDEDTVVDIGANDGTLLMQYGGASYEELKLVAWEPASNLQAELVNELTGLVTLNKFKSGRVIPKLFPSPECESIGDAKIITSIAMFYDLADPNAFVQAIQKMLHPAGIWVIQLTGFSHMLTNNSWDNICHEHLEYYTLKSLQYLLYKHHLRIVDLEENDVNGGSIRVYVAHRHSGPAGFGGALDRLAGFQRKENQLGITDLPEGPAISRFINQFQQSKRQIRQVLLQAVMQGMTVDIYGASTKGNTTLQVAGINSRDIFRQAIERAEAKYGKVLPGSEIPIVSELQSKLGPADMWLVLPWHFRHSFINREKEYLAMGGQMLFPMPMPEIVKGVVE